MLSTLHGYVKNHFKNIIKKTSHFHILLYLLYKLLFLLAFSFCEVQYCNSHLLNYIFGRIPWNIAPNPGKPWVKAKAAPPWHIALCSFVALWFCDVMECATLAYYALRCHGLHYPGTLRSVWCRGVVDWYGWRRGLCELGARTARIDLYNLGRDCTLGRW